MQNLLEYLVNQSSDLKEVNNGYKDYDAAMINLDDNIRIVVGRYKLLYKLPKRDWPYIRKWFDSTGYSNPNDVFIITLEEDYGLFRLKHIEYTSETLGKAINRFWKNNNPNPLLKFKNNDAELLSASMM